MNLVLGALITYIGFVMIGGAWHDTLTDIWAEMKSPKP